MDEKSKYNLPLLTAEEFNQRPESFELRKGTTAGAPLCPAGNLFKFVGYDLVNVRYVRLTKSVFRKLVKVHSQKDSLPDLKTERLSLSQLTTDDWKEVSFLRTDNSVNQFVKRSSAPSKNEALAFIEKINTGVLRGEFYYWKISLKNQTKMIGSISLWNFSEDKQKVEVGYDLHPEYQRKGMMNEAMIHILKFVFNELHVQRVEAYTQWQNDPSISLLTRNGFSLDTNIKDPDNPDNRVYVVQKNST